VGFVDYIIFYFISTSTTCDVSIPIIALPQFLAGGVAILIDTA